MRRQVTLDIHLDHPPARVFPYFADPGTWPDWAPAGEVRRWVGEGPTFVVSRWSAVDRIIGPFRVRFEDVLEVVETDERVVWHSTSPWNSRVEYACAAERGGTRVRADYGGDVTGWLRLVALLPTFVLARILMRDFRGLQRLLDTEDARAEVIGEPTEPA